jgi:hypothetical protein
MAEKTYQAPQAAAGFMSAEAKWIAAHSNTHYTRRQIWIKTQITLYKLDPLLPKPCLIYPKGNRSKLWSKCVIDELFCNG